MRNMVKKKKKSKKSKGNWKIILDDGTIVETGYYPNARMAVGEVLKKNPGSKIKDVKYIK